MILSFHPVIEADQNIICAGRNPNEHDLKAIQSAKAVILPQGCPEALYRMARNHCANIFPNMDIRFDYPGKCNQIRLFRKIGIAHPKTKLFKSTQDIGNFGQAEQFPLILKLDWGGQGDTVCKVDDSTDFEKRMEWIKGIEKTGQHGFLAQQYIPCQNRSLRVVCIDDQLYSYWRIQGEKDKFGASIAKGARIEYEAAPHLQSAAKRVVRTVCQTTGIQLAGFDFLFDEYELKSGHIEPLMLEINFYFGRTGLGGSQRFYDLLNKATDNWLNRIEDA